MYIYAYFFFLQFSFPFFFFHSTLTLSSSHIDNVQCRYGALSFVFHCVNSASAVKLDLQAQRATNYMH